MKRLFDIFRRKKNEPQPQPQINYQFVGQPMRPQQLQSFVIDEQRHQVVRALLEGAPFFIVYQTANELKTTAEIRHDLLILGIKQLAKDNAAFSDDLLNVVIDVNTEKRK